MAVWAILSLDISGRIDPSAIERLPIQRRRGGEFRARPKSVSSRLNCRYALEESYVRTHVQNVLFPVTAETDFAGYLR